MENSEERPTNFRKQQLFEQLKLLVHEEKLYRNPYLNRSILAKHLSTNQTYVSDCVRQIVGQSLAEYIDTLRLSECIGRLKAEEEKSLAILAEEVGYLSYTTFYRAFVKLYGMSPAEYRQLLNNG